MIEVHKKPSNQKRNPHKAHSVPLVINESLFDYLNGKMRHENSIRF